MFKIEYTYIVYMYIVLSTSISTVYGFKSEIRKFENPITGPYDFFREKSLFVHTYLYYIICIGHHVVVAAVFTDFLWS